MGMALAVAPSRDSIAAGKQTLHFTVPFPPSLNNLFKNAGRKGRVISDGYKAWREEAGYLLNRQRLTPLPGPVVVSIAVPDRGKCDLDNLAKAIIDLAVERKLIDGDGRAVVRGLHLFWAQSDEVVVSMVRATT